MTAGIVKSFGLLRKWEDERFKVPLRCNSFQISVSAGIDLM